MNKFIKENYFFAIWVVLVLGFEIAIFAILTNIQDKGFYINSCQKHKELYECVADWKKL
jgi:hypothetical protein